MCGAGASLGHRRPGTAESDAPRDDGRPLRHPERACLVEIGERLGLGRASSEALVTLKAGRARLTRPIAPREAANHAPPVRWNDASLAVTGAADRL
jgi:hypothetical protein